MYVYIYISFREAAFIVKNKFHDIYVYTYMYVYVYIYMYIYIYKYIYIFVSSSSEAAFIAKNKFHDIKISDLSMDMFIYTHISIIFMNSTFSLYVF